MPARHVAVRSIDVEHATLHVEEHGSGAPVMLLHAGLSSSATWAAILPHLVGDFRVITPDTRGHGRSTNASGQLSYPQLADDVAALIAALGLDRPIVGGYSDGGQVALELGARHPGTAGGLIVGAAYPEFVASGLRQIFRAVLGADDDGAPDLAQVDAVLGDAAQLLKARHPGGAEQWRVLVDQVARMWLDYPGLADDAVRAIEAPVLLFTGDRDGLIPLELILALYEALPNAELAVCPHTDHTGAMAPARAPLFAAAIRDFAARHAAPTVTPAA